jgi:hypothetical protein
MTQLPFWAPPTLTGRGATLPSGATTITLSPWPERVTACCGSRMALPALACSSCTRTYMPGSSRPCGLGTSARSVTWPLPGSTLRSENSRRAGWA